LDYPADVAVETLRGLGFREERALTWMRHSYSKSHPPGNPGVTRSESL
jgi:hypothetical protein